MTWPRIYFVFPGPFHGYDDRVLTLIVMPGSASQQADRFMWLGFTCLVLDSFQNVATPKVNLQGI